MARRIAMAVAATAVLTLAGCGESDRDRVDAYVKQANEVQKQAAPDFKQANKNYAHVIDGKIEPAKLVTGTARSERAIEGARARLAALSPPQPAEKLHRLLLALFDRNVVLARETAQLAVYQRGADLAVRPLGSAEKTLGGLADLPDAPSQASAMRSYSASLSRGLAALRKLRPPPLVEPAHRDLVRRLTRTRLAAGRLAEALASSNAGAVAELVTNLRAATAAAPRRGLLARSIRAYNRRYAQIGRAAAAVQREHNRLDADLD